VAEPAFAAPQAQNLDLNSQRFQATIIPGSPHAHMGQI
jgi:hypothetical protein